MRKIVAILFAWMCLASQALAFDTCDIGNPKLPCSINEINYDTFAGNYSGSRLFYKTNSYELTVNEEFLSLNLKDGLPHNHGWAYIAGYGTPVWTSPPPYNVDFGVFGQFSGSGVERANHFEWLGVGSPTPPLFEFPVPQDKNGNPFNAYTAPISSVMDRSTLGTGTPYDDSDHQVVSFEGEVGDQGPYTGSTCYAKANGKAFGKNINYKGTSGTGGKYYLCYNGHPGYDYPFAKKTPIHAAMSGTLCVATTKITYIDGVKLWRNPQYCPLSLAGGTSWAGYHTFYMVHKGLTYNESTDDYMTVYLHSNNLEPNIQATIASNGYADVIITEHVADVGGYGPSGPDTYGYHLHFEMYKWNAVTSNWDRIDPYGDGVNNILWVH